MAEVPNVVYGIAILLFFILGGLFAIGNLDKNHSLAQDPEYKTFNKTFDQLNAFDSQVQDVKSNMNNDDSSALFGNLGALGSLLQQGWNALNLVWSSVGLLSDLFTNIGVMFHVPGFIIALASLVIIITVVFGIIYLVFNRG